jgi:PAS domain S-box-containing protein
MRRQVIDVTELKRLLETNRLIFERSLSPMIMIDTKGIILQYNECAESLFGYTKAEVRGGGGGDGDESDDHDHGPK